MLKSVGLYLCMTILVSVRAGVNGRMAFFRGSWKSNLSVSVCPRKTWGSQCLDLSPEWALSGSESPMELRRTHKDSLFTTVTAHPHERESQTQILASQSWMNFTVNIRKRVFKGRFNCAWNLILLLHTFTMFSYPSSAPSSVRRLLLSDSERLFTSFAGSLRWLDKVLFTVPLGYFWPH